MITSANRRTTRCADRSPPPRRLPNCGVGMPLTRLEPADGGAYGAEDDVSLPANDVVVVHWWDFFHVKRAARTRLPCSMQRWGDQGDSPRHVRRSTRTRPTSTQTRPPDPLKFCRIAAPRGGPAPGRAELLDRPSRHARAAAPAGRCRPGCSGHFHGRNLGQCFCSRLVPSYCSSGVRPTAPAAAVSAAWPLASQGHAGDGEDDRRQPKHDHCLRRWLRMPPM